MMLFCSQGWFFCFSFYVFLLSFFCFFFFFWFLFFFLVDGILCVSFFCFFFFCSKSPQRGGLDVRHGVGRSPCTNQCCYTDGADAVARTGGAHAPAPQSALVVQLKVVTRARSLREQY